MSGPLHLSETEGNHIYGSRVWGRGKGWDVDLGVFRKTMKIGK